MTPQEMNNASKRIVEFKMTQIKFHVRKKYRQASQWDKLSGAWLDTLHPSVDEEIKYILTLVDGQYSYLNVAVAAMNEKSLKLINFELI